ncbi:MAG: DUF2062 domain-containing protein [Pseudomonadota bacterium]
MRELVYPHGGFLRATRYVIHRMRRLPDEPHRVARGIFAGCLIGFLPLPGIQFVVAAMFAWVIRGNIFAALLGTFNSNPITTPVFAVASISLGHWMLGIETPLTSEAIGRAFYDAGDDLWRNVMAIFTPAKAHWGGLMQFWDTIYVPYLIGSLGPAVILSLIFYYLTIPVVQTYQKARAAKSKERSEKRSRLRAALTEATARLKAKTDAARENKDDDAPDTH